MSVSVETLYEQWERELAQLHREPDSALISGLEAEARTRGVELLELHEVLHSMTAAVYEEALHPRGHDGKWIELGGIVKLLNYKIAGKNGKNYDFSGHRGKVLGISPDKKAGPLSKDLPPDIRVGVLRPDQSDDDTPTTIVNVKPNNVEAAPQKARLSVVPETRAESGLPSASVRSTITPEQAAAVAADVKAGNPVDCDPADVDDVIANFADSPDPVDLTLINMFSAMRASGIPRAQMPQIPKEHLQTFKNRLKERGIRYESQSADPRTLLATQAELDGKNVSGMMRSARDGSFDLLKDPIWISNDGHLLDGHHRWAAATAMSADCGGCVVIPAVRVDMSMSELLDFANAFNDEMGVQRLGFGTVREKESKTAAGPPPAEDDGLTMATDAEDGITDADLEGLPHGVVPDGSAFFPDGIPWASSAPTGPPASGDEDGESSSPVIARASFDPDLHPRGRDGQFIEKLGLVKLFNFKGVDRQGRDHDLSGRRAQVTNIVPKAGSPGNPDIKIRLLNDSGQPAGPELTAKPSNIEAGSDKGRLSTKTSWSQQFDDLYGQLEPPRQPSQAPSWMVPTQAPAPKKPLALGDPVTDEAMLDYVKGQDVEPESLVVFPVDGTGNLNDEPEILDYDEDVPDDSPLDDQFYEWVDVDSRGVAESSMEPPTQYDALGRPTTPTSLTSGKPTVFKFPTAAERRATLIAGVNAKAAALSTTDAQARADGLEAILGNLRFSVIDTNQTYNHIFPPKGSTSRWTPEREAQHEEMFGDIAGRADAAGIPKEGKAWILGGLPGSGKTTALHGEAGATLGVNAWDPSTQDEATPGVNAISIDPDVMKEMMIQRGMLPEGIEGLKPREQATFLHEESVYLSKQFAQRLSNEGYNLVLDSTLRDTNEALNRMSPLAHNGYEFRGLFVDIPIDESVESAQKRYLEQALTPLGGRYVPSSVTGNRKSSKGNMSKNRDAFDTLVQQDWFTNYMVVDNTGIAERQPKGTVTKQGSGTGSAVNDLLAPPQAANRPPNVPVGPTTPLFPPPQPAGSQGHHEIPGVGNVDEYLAANPQQPGEAYFEWQSRICDGLPPDSKHALLFETRERYEPVDFIAAGMTQWRADHDRPEPVVDLSEVPAPREKADAVARTFEAAPDQSDDPRVQQAFFEFKKQSAEMWDFMTKPESEGGLGIRIDFDPNEAGDPYPDATSQAEDLRNNHHMTTQSGLGGAHELTMTTEEYDRFRAVHDVFGHAGIGGGFDRHGEYQAYLAHSSMYWGDGRWAMASEYHGVNTAMWAGDPGTPGSGKSVLLPPELVPDPFAPTGEIIAASAAPAIPEPMQLEILGIDQAHAESLAYLAGEAGIEPPFGQWYDPSPLHSLPPPPETTELPDGLADEDELEAQDEEMPA